MRSEGLPILRCIYGGLQFSTFLDGSEGESMYVKASEVLQYSTFSHGAESKYAFAPSLMVLESTILQILL